MKKKSKKKDRYKSHHHRCHQHYSGTHENVTRRFSNVSVKYLPAKIYPLKLMGREKRKLKTDGPCT